MRRLTAIVLMAACAAAQAARVESVSPQGEVGEVRQVVVRYGAPVRPLGDLRGPDPYAVACNGPAPAGQGRWADERTWLYDFKTALPPGVRCTATPRPEWKPLEGALEGVRAFSFGTGGPAVLQVQPWEGSEVEEDQHFLLTLNGAATEASVTANAGCEVEGIGERLPLRVVTGAARDAVLKSRRVPAERAARTLLATCARPLPQDTPVRLVWGPGIAAAANPAVVTRITLQWRYRVRKAFTAEFHCERERAEAACLPIRPLRLRFSAPVERALAAQARLRPAAGGTPLAPVFDADDKSPTVTALAFPHPQAENATFTVELPAGLLDDAGRALANAGLFPLKVATGEAPPIAKFASAPFGIVERRPGEALLPITLRHVQGDLRPAAPAGRVRVKRVVGDAEILDWYARVKAHHERQISAKDAGLPADQWFTIERDTDARGRPRERRIERWVGTREVALLKADAQAKRLELPALQGGDPRPFEVIGLPLPEPGYHVVEVESPRLGAALLGKPAPMYVRTGVLVTDLAVHVKHGRENSLVWVTGLDSGRPVEGAEIAVHDCNGVRLWAGRSDAQGLARIAQAIDATRPRCVADEGLFVTARKTEGGVTDVAFAFSSWQRGIEGWRFGHPTAAGPGPELHAHTVFDRTLLRAGETVSMKHFIRAETAAGFAALLPAALPTRMKITHVGSGQEVSLPLQWPAGRHALASWTIPPAARLGAYQVTLEREASAPGGARSLPSGEFRVEAFRVPLVDARLAAPGPVPVAPKALPLALQINYQSGGGVAQAPVKASALLRPRWPSFAGYEDWSFAPPREGRDQGPMDDEPFDGEDQPAAAPDGRLVADKLALTTDANGAATIKLDKLPPITRPSELLAEASFEDPNGETQTVATRIPLWPSAVVLGLKTAAWAGTRGGKASFQVLALDTAGRPIANQAVEVRARVSQWLSTRQRMVGGFYAYDNRRETTDLGAVCSGRSDAKGLLACEADLARAGEVELVAASADAQGRRAEAAATVWVTRRGELWFAQDNDDRIDVLPEKKRYEPGETARFQVRSPFRSATALVAVEREGVIDTRLVTLRGDDPTVALKIDPAWAPNVYVSVLAVRGRVHQVPWYTLFTWGWRHPVDWWHSWRDGGRDFREPTAMVDLARPAHKFGVAAIQVGRAAHELQVSVTPDRSDYRVRGRALARVKVTQDGRPLAGSEVAFAAVDEGLLALRDNESWDLLGAMLRPRPWGVETATAQGEVIGRRHYGRKAVAAGGGGGRGGTRELFDTLLLWKPSVVLDAKGEATIEVPLNDSLTSFRLVAVADQGVARFGSGSARIRVTQDLQLLPGLPPLVRDGDRFRAGVTLRNTTARPMTLQATLAGAAQRDGADALTIATAPQSLTLAAGAAQELFWDIDVPPMTRRIDWDAAVLEQGGAAPLQDRVKLSQAVVPAVPERVLQATIAQLDGRLTLPVAAPIDALPATGPKQGGLVVALQPRLTGALPGLRRWFEAYPFTCLEQQVAKAIGLRDALLWQRVVNMLPTYLDADGLASYFPVREGDRPNGSDRLTAHILSAAHEAGFELPAELRERMLVALGDFVEGRIERRFWAPREDRDVRKLAALDALSRHGRAQPRQLGSIHLTPNLWPTAAVIDWLRVLQRVPGIAQGAERRAEAQQILRARLTWGGTTLRFSTETSDDWWWLMDSADANAARLVLAVLAEPGWRDELPRLVLGSLARQQGGAWRTTTANVWGALALDKFGAAFESQPVAGRSEAVLGASRGAVDWAAQPEGGSVRLPWPAAPATLAVEQQGSGKPWVTVQGLAAIPLKAPLAAGYTIKRSTSAVSQKTPGRWSRGDVMRVRLEIDVQGDMAWVVLSDPVPGGATLLGSGLGRDSALATRGERREGWAWPAFEERSPEAFRSYYEHLPRGRHVIEYSLRLGAPGRYALPPTRVEAMYAPETFGEVPNEAVEVEP